MIISQYDYQIENVSVKVDNVPYNFISYNLVKEEYLHDRLMIGSNMIQISNFDNIYYNYFSTNNCSTLTGNNVRAIVHNIDDIDIKGECIISNSILLKKYDSYVISEMQFERDESNESYITLEFSQDVVNYIENNILNINIDYNSISYIDGNNINKSNVFNYEFIRNNNKEEYNEYKLYFAASICLYFICIFIAFELLIIFAMIHKKYQHSKEILLSLYFTNYKLRLIYYITSIFIVFSYIIALLLFVILKNNLLDMVRNITQLDVYNFNSFNYTILINLLIQIIITFCYAFKHKSIFYIDRM